MRKNLRRVRKEDFERVVLTETLPYEVPVIFSNFGFYSILKKLKQGKIAHTTPFDFIFNKKDYNSYTIPLNYKIRKNEQSFRNMSLLHPTSQIGFINLYRDFAPQIVNSCKKSNYSLRKPHKIANKYYIKNRYQQDNAYKSNQPSDINKELNSRYLTSYFSYSNYTRLHYFYDSYEFMELEKKYSNFYSLDISKCFDSIYTHSITWALKTKVFSKNHKNIDNTLGNVFDKAMQSCNFNETAGIVIGPEVSRIFAEIIFQEIDKNIETKINSAALIHGVHYDIRRYVDDILVFTLDKNHIEVITPIIEDCLNEYNFSLNEGKTKNHAHPFVTNKTKSLVAIKHSLAELTNKLITRSEEDSYSIEKIRNSKHLIISFVNQAKSACIEDIESYNLACGFIIASLTRLILTYCQSYQKTSVEDKNSDAIRIFFELTITLIFHFFTISPTHASSANICKVIHASCDFFEKDFKDEENSIKTHIYKLCNDFFESSKFKDLEKGQDSCPLETLNIICSLKRLGDNFELPESKLSSVLHKKNNFSYFEIICTLYYIGNSGKYVNLKSNITKQVKRHLETIIDIRESTFKCYLLFDVLGCPYFDLKIKKQLAKKYFMLISQGLEPTDSEINDLINEIYENSWFTSWNEATLLNLLEKKDLLKGY